MSARTNISRSARPTPPIPPYDGHHVQIYIADFSGPYERLRQRGLIMAESARHQYRFKDIVDL